MKRALTILALMATTSAHAGGLAEPIPEARIETSGSTQPSFAGTTIGLSYGRTTAELTETFETHETIECGERNCDVEVPENLIGNADIEALARKDHSLPKGDPDRNCGGMTYDCSTNWNSDDLATWVWLTEALTVKTGEYDVTTTNQSTGAGVFINHRIQRGAGVFGGEMFTDGTLTTAELSAGYAMGRVLPYAFAGAGKYDRERGGVYGGGLDWLATDSVVVGVKYTAGEFEDTDLEMITARVSFKF